MHISIQDIEYFLMVVDHGQVSRAASACMVSQPALSKSLRRLEEETGLQLLERSTRGMKLTSAGLVFVEHARRLKAEYSDAIRHASELKLGKAGLLRIGATGATMDAYVMPALAALLPRRPALRVALTVDLSDSLYHRVDQGDLDMAVAPTFSSQPLPLKQTPVGKDLLRIVARTSHPLRYKSTLGLADLVGFPWILPRPQAIARQRLASLFAESNLPAPNAALETDFISKGCFDLVAATDLLALVPTSFIDAQTDTSVSLLPFTMELSREISLLARRNAIWTPLMNEFRTVLEGVMNPDRK
jgi:DNA-binding transcriptional LysR family regulator